MLNKIRFFILKNKYIIMAISILYIIVILFLFNKKVSYQDKIDESMKITETEVASMSEASTENIDILPLISEEEKEVLKAIYLPMSEGLFEIPASIIISNSNILENLYINTLKDEAYIFDGENILQLDEAKGSRKYLLISDISTFYYGYIKNSLPNGEGNIINAYAADYNRYNYSLGNWVDGKLNGVGESGSAAFGEFPENTTTLYAIKGDFTDDILNGEIQLDITDEKGQTNTYLLNSYEGISVIDEKLFHNEAMARYELSSLEDESQKYSIKDAEINDKKWINKVILK